MTSLQEGTQALPATLNAKSSRENIYTSTFTFIFVVIYKMFLENSYSYSWMPETLQDIWKGAPKTWYLALMAPVPHTHSKEPLFGFA